MTKRLLILLILVCLLPVGVAYGEDGITTRLKDFVSEVYHDYAAESFAEVYGVMYPTIRDVVTEEDYVSFQEGHFTKLRLQLTDIEVGDVRETPRLPRTLRPFVQDQGNVQTYGVEISYNAQFVRAGRHRQSISKTVYVALLDSGTAEELYLLWDPNSMQEEETGT
ncbi:MAG: hypothetical protein GX979_02260 [Firmicutes bacterium]|nr:hypothetical protein [Bacillota bacterium]